MTGSNLLGVICTYHNAQDTIAIATKSLAAQTVQDMRVVMVDDGGADDSAKIVETLVGNDPRFESRRINESRGAGYSRNWAMRELDTKYIAFIDADDWVAPDFYADVVRVLEDTGLPYARCGHTLCFGKRRQIRTVPHRSATPVASCHEGVLPVFSQTMVDYPWIWSGMYQLEELRKRDLRYDETLQTAEDRLLAWRLINEFDQFAVAPTFGYFYRRGVSGSLTSLGDHRQNHIFPAMDSVIQYLRNYARDPAYLYKAYRQCIALSAHHYNNRHRLTPSARREMRSLIREQLRRIPENDLELSMQGMSPKRRRIFHALRRGGWI